ncbi:hypothetical protein MKW94_029111, partial [Papaver nudicaule]|nr:hypothetical protein [Papaver nudicaule]
MVVRFLNYILLHISESKCALVYSQMNEPPGACARVGLTCLTVAEHFRDAEGQDVLLFIDYIFRFTQANSEVSALLGRIPSAVGYQPTLATDLGGLQERITTTEKGSITSVQAIYVPADISELSIYPAVDPLDSTSHMLLPHILGEAHYNTILGENNFLDLLIMLLVEVIHEFDSLILNTNLLQLRPSR